LIEFALGSLGWTEYEFYCTTPKAFYLAQRGYHKEKELLQHYFRRHAYIIHASLVPKPAQPEALWPIGEAEIKAKETDEEFKARMLMEGDEIIKEFLQKQGKLAQA
jgi:hypothetical protein